MKEILLNYLFPIITSLRRIEMQQITEGNHTEAEAIRAINKKFSEIRDKIITAQLMKISRKNEKSLLSLSKTNTDLSNYILLKKKSESKLASVLSALPALLSTLDALIK